ATLPLSLSTDPSPPDPPPPPLHAALPISQWIFLSPPAVAGHEDRLRRFAAVFRVLPAEPSTPTGPSNDPHAMRFDGPVGVDGSRSEEHTSELQSLTNIVCRLLLETKNSDD